MRMFGSGGELEKRRRAGRENIHCMVFKQESEPGKKTTAV